MERQHGINIVNPLTQEFLVETWDTNLVQSYRRKYWGKTIEGSIHVEQLPQYLSLAILDPIGDELIHKSMISGNEWLAFVGYGGNIPLMVEGEEDKFIDEHNKYIATVLSNDLIGDVHTHRVRDSAGLVGGVSRDVIYRSQVPQSLTLAAVVDHEERGVILVPQDHSPIHDVTVKDALAFRDELFQKLTAISIDEDTSFRLAVLWLITNLEVAFYSGTSFSYLELQKLQKEEKQLIRNVLVKK